MGRMLTIAMLCAGCSSAPDTGADSGRSRGEAACGVDDLVVHLEATTATGVSRSAFAPGEAPTLAAIVANPCDEDVDVDLDGPLVAAIDVYDANADGVGMGLDDDGPTRVTIPARGRHVETFAWSPLAAGDWSADVAFGFGRAASTTFEVK